MSDPGPLSVSYGEFRFVQDGGKPPPPPRKSWFKLFLDGLSVAQTVLLAAILFISAFAILWITVKEVASDAVVLEEIGLAKPLADMGYSGQVAAHRLWGAANAIYDEAALTSEKARLVAESRQLEITESKTGLSLRGLADMLRALIGREQTVVGGEFVCRDPECSLDRVELRLRVFSDGEMRQVMVGPIGPIEADGELAESVLDTYFQNAAVALLRVLDPLVAATYLIYRDPPTAERLANKLYLSAHETGPQAAGLIGLIKAETGGYDDALSWYETEVSTSSGRDPTSDGNALVQWGFALDALGRPDEARQKFVAANALFDRAVDRKPNPDAFNSWGWSLVSLGDSDGAIEKFRQAVALDRDYAYAYAGWGVALAARADREDPAAGRALHAEALGRFSLAVDVEPDYAFALARWANSLARLGRLEEAFAKYEEAARAAPRAPWILVEWGNHLLAAERRLPGFRKFAQAMELSPNEPWALGDWCKHLTQMGRVERARFMLESYSAQADVPPRSSGIARAMWARELWQSGERDLAMEQFALAAELAPTEAWLFRDWADFSWQAGNRAEALDRFAKAADLAPAESSYAANYSDRLWDDLQHDRAIEQSARAASLSPDDQAYFSTLIDRLYDQNRDAEALAEFERRSIPIRTPAWMSQRAGMAYADVRPAGGIDQAWLHAGWGNYLWSRGRQDEALAKFELAAAWAPADAGYRLHLADHLFEAGDPQAALLKYASVLDAEPGNPRALVQSGLALAALGRHEEAVLRYIELSKIDPPAPGLLDAWAQVIDQAVRTAPEVDCAKLAALMDDIEPVAARAETTDGLADLHAERDRCAAPPTAAD